MADTEIYGVLLDNLREFDRKFWTQFVQAHHRWRWIEFPSCGGLRTILDAVQTKSGRVSALRKCINILRYDGVCAVCMRLLAKLRRRIRS